MTDPATPQPRPQSRRTRILVPAAIVLSLALVWWLHDRWSSVRTDDARIAATMIEVSSSAAGLLVDFPISSGDQLGPGDLIAQLDDRAAVLSLRELEAQAAAMESSMDSVRARIDMTDQDSGGKLRAAKSQLTAALALLSSARSDLEFKRSEMERAESLKERQIISTQQWENARNALQQSQQAYERANADVESARAAVTAAGAGQTQLQVLANDLIALQHEQERLQLSMERQRVLIDDLRIDATRAGVIDQTFVDAGEYVVPGQRIALMHDPDDIWISANIKETEFRLVEPGDPVSITVDAYPGETFSGEVLKVGNAATSQFSLLPSTSPSGNFTKVTQRLPVKISVDAAEGILRPGMMVEVSIAVR